MGFCNMRSLLLAAIVLCNCITWTSSRHHYTHNVLRHRSRHRRQGAGLFLTASHILPGGEGSGAWGPWGQVSPCSRTCGGGVASQKRICLEVDSEGRPRCSGGDTKYFSCQTQDCPEGGTDFRSQQCSEYDTVPVNGISYQWVPYIKTDYPCELNCKPRGERFYYRQKKAVTDGTRCNENSFDVCVNGTCQPVGCDMMLGSNAREDKCRECRGNNTNCHTISGRIDSQDLTKGYNDVFLIPAGATSIVIEEVGPSNNYLALRSKQYKKYYLNGNYHIDFPRSIEIAGALWQYERSHTGMLAPDKLRCLGPTSEPLYLSLLLQDQNVGIQYEYSIPQNQAPPPDQHYGWVFDAYSPCSTTCGGGIQYRNVTCRSREELKQVEDSLCEQGMRPPTNQSCASQACAAQWVEGPWNPCSKPCGEGGTRSRSVHCQKVITNGYPSVVDDSECISHLGSKPDLYQECNKNESCPTWFTGPWKPCDKLCGEGKQTRQVVCHQKTNGKVQVFGDSSCREEKPAVEQSCILHPCEGVDWVVSDWSGCDTCLSKVRTRQLECATLEKQVVNSSFCSNHPKPALLEEPCDRTKLPACTVQWYATQWNNCSAECGKGVQTRHVFCGLFDGSSVLKVDDSRCENETKYKDFRPCEVPEEKCPSKWFAGPWSECTKTCGGGDQYRRVMCLKGSLEATDCNGEIILDNRQACNTGPCDKDETLPLNVETTPIMDDDYDEEDCEDDDIESAEAEPEENEFTDILGRLSTPEEGSGTDLGIDMESGSGAEPDASVTATTLEMSTTWSDDYLRSTTEPLPTIADDSQTTLDNTLSSTATPQDTNSTTSDSTATTTEAASTTLSSNDTSSTDSGSTKAESTTTPQDTNSTTSDSNATTTDAFTTTLSSNETSSTDSGSTKAESTATPQDTNSTTSDYNSTTTDALTTTLSSNETSSTDSGSTKAESTATPPDSNSTMSDSNATTTEALTTTLSSNEPSSTDSGSTKAESITPTLDTNSTTSDSSATTAEASTTILSSNDTSSGTSFTPDMGTTMPDDDLRSTTEPLPTITDDIQTSSDNESSSTATPQDMNSTTSDSNATTTDALTTTLSSNETSSTDSGSTTAESTVTPLDTNSTTSDSNTTTTEAVPTTLSSNETSTEGGSTTAESTITPLDTNITTSDSNTTTTEAVPITVSSNDTSSTDSGSTTAESTITPLDTNSTTSDSNTTTEAVPTTLSSNETSSTDSGSTTAENTITPLDTNSTTSDSNTTTTEAVSTTVSSNDTSSTDGGSTKAESTVSPLDTNGTMSTEAFTTTLSSNDSSSTESGSTKAEGTSPTLDMSTMNQSSSTESSTTDSLSTKYGSTTTESLNDYGSTVNTSETGSTEITNTDVSQTEDTSSSDETTPYDWLSTVEIFTKPSRCKPRRKSKCAKTKFGCCPDKRTAAAGPFDLGCDNPTTCKESKHGCCPDGVSPAQGPDDKECPLPPCRETLYGCCESDGKTPAEGNDQEGCPPPQPKCMSSKFGCCKDNQTEAKGHKKKGCPETETSKGCADSKHGCCYDNHTVATGPGEEGCPCAATEFGCCPDNVTPARGPQMEGCQANCNTSAFGCCPDGETPAHGPEHEGCCHLLSFGCCPDNYKAAEGPRMQGCGCQYAHFGCCPDNVTIARGNENEGCGCKYSEHGCCPDSHTEATGPKFEGCGCHTYQFGCCPDGTTIAKGPSLQGCHCLQSQHGCCGDGETAAQGPDMAGCDCAASKYGCCPDGQTEAKGEKFSGCSDIPEDRQASCVLDKSRGNCTNYTVAYYYDTTYGGCSRFWYGGCEGNGNRFADQAECEDVCIHPSPKNACNLPKVKGACNEYYLRWYYDAAREQCGQFVYGGCLGNDNNFQTRESCQKQCEPPRSEDQCKVPIDRGSCAGNFSRWGFDVSSGRCEQFTWGGCEGNGNRFPSEAACVQRCDPPGALKPECTLPQAAGNCTEKLARWSFSESENRCVPFYFTGCNGNQNNFVAEQHCTERCPSAFVPDMCALPAETGTCSNYREKWYYDTTLERCRQFYYGGCGGNGNNFNTEVECERRCQQQPATTTARPAARPPAARPPAARPPSGQEICFIEKDPGPCNQMETRWAYDSRAGACAPFQYGGCAGNQNNFQSQEYCQRYCVSVQDLCQLPMSAGPCQGSEIRWFYDASSDSCSQFTYGGCEGNENRFDSRERCEQRCRSGPQVTPTPNNNVAVVEPVAPECRSSPVEPCSEPGEVWYYEPQQSECLAHYNPPSGSNCRRTNVYRSQEACERTCGSFRGLEVCRYPLDAGQCDDRLPKFFFNETGRVCQPFTYGGCLGGPNRFSTADECRATCVPEASADPCSEPRDSGPCRGYHIKWYFDRQRGRCEQFVFGGCQGNDNKFDTREECEGRCAAPAPAPQQPDTSIPEPEPEDVSAECQAPASLAPCGDNSTTFYYDASRGLCLRGEFGRCRYANSYRSEEECERRCGAFRNYADVCHEPLDPGPCRASIPKFWYNSETGACTVFAYGGCQGGANRFSFIEECEELCVPTGPAPRCLVPLSTGSPFCGEVHTRRYYYNPDEGECLPFNYLGCHDNGNNFNSYLECTRVCGATGTENVCDSYNAECARLRCPNGVQRAATAEGCERCVCAPEPAPEPQPGCDQYEQECKTLRCQLGIERSPAGACERCKCKVHPCTNFPCQAGDRCVAQPYRDPVTQEAGYNPVCRTVHKPGTCPASAASVESSECRLQCRDDADCQGQAKCCSQGCHHLCLSPSASQTTPWYTTPRTTAFVPDNKCDSYNAECARLRCPNGVQRAATAEGCERCVCAPEPAPEPQPGCAQYAQECTTIRCPFGVERSFDGACDRCRCKEHPCADLECQEDERCVLQPNTDPVTQELLGYSPICRTMRKPGTCPVSAASADEECRRECNDDADCPEQAKCCSQGCSQLCLAPSASPTTPWYTTPRTTTYVPELQQAPQPNPATVPEVTVGEQGMATLRCLFHGNPPPKITWQRGQITIDGSVGRYRLLSDGALEIVSLYRNDTGVYICVADNEHGSARQEVRLQVVDPVTQPAGISGEEKARLTAELGQELVLRCLAYGSPTPTVAWYRGNSMVPYSSHQYEARGIYLQIKSLAVETLGEYACQAFNGVGPPASWSVVVQAYRPDLEWVARDSPYLVDREPAVVRVTPRPPARPAPATRPTTSTTLPPPEPEPYNAPVSTRLVSSQTSYGTGSDLSIGCDVDGFPTPQVYWTKDGEPLGNSDRVTVSDSRLLISRVVPADSGEYGCHARNAYSSSYALERIEVQGQLLPQRCKDNPLFAKCSLIVSSKFCGHKYYSQLCCKSCLEAGQMTVAELESYRQMNPI